MKFATLPAGGALAALAALSALAAATIATPARAEDADTLRDPMRPPVVSQAVSAPEIPPVLSAVMGSAGRLVAIFNGRLVRSGDKVGDYVIETVFAAGVRYRHAGVSHDLLLVHTPEFKKPSHAARLPLPES